MIMNDKRILFYAPKMGALTAGEVIKMDSDGRLYGGEDEISVYHYVRVEMRRFLMRSVA